VSGGKSVDIAPGYRLDGCSSIPGRDMTFFFISHSLHNVFGRGVKRPGHEADHSPPSSADVKNGGAVSPLPHMSSWRTSTTFPLPLPSFVSVRMWLVISIHNFADWWIFIFRCENYRTQARHVTFGVQTRHKHASKSCMKYCLLLNNY
jgi:hypothetical protein